MSNVISLNGEELLSPGETCHELITELEELLERARSGDLHGIHAVLVHSDQSITKCRTLTANYRSVGAAFSMAMDMSKEM